MKNNNHDHQKTYRDDQGLLVKEVTEVTDLESGAVREVHETHRQEVPMRLEERVTRTLERVPVEEKTELFGTDGSVQTKIKTLPENPFDALDLESEVSSSSDEGLSLVLKQLEALDGQDKQLDRKLDQLLACKAKHAAECKSTQRTTYDKDQIGVNFGKKGDVTEKPRVDKGKCQKSASDEVLQALALLTSKVEKLEKTEVAHNRVTSFMGRATSKYGDQPSGSAPVTTNSERAPVKEEAGTVEKVVAGLGWIAFAVVGGLIVLALL